MNGRFFLACLVCLWAAGVSCKKKAEEPRAGGPSIPATIPPAAAEGEPAERGTEPGLAAKGDLSGSRATGEGTASAGAAGTAGGSSGTGEGGGGTAAGGATQPVEPAEPAAAPPGDVPKVLPCPWSEIRRAAEPSTPDPEAGDFTMDEAMAGISGTGRPVATIETTMGTVSCALEGDRVPRGVANFVGLARGLRPWWDPCRKAWVKEPYYDGLTFHRVIPTFMAQGGDLFGNGMGGPGYQFPSEILPDLLHDRPGTLAYANSGPDTNGSQFYITVGRRSQLDGGYVVFGYCDNVDVIEKIVAVPRDENAGDRPYSPVWIRHVTITRAE
ncbi:MAG: peptidylprolyl isomerase [Deltaproteobacteria bacterium]|nr:peptidylprolyl isomerase [Deltaproteobacteria bacterium]